MPNRARAQALSDLLGRTRSDLTLKTARSCRKFTIIPKPRAAWASIRAHAGKVCKVPAESMRASWR